MKEEAISKLNDMIEEGSVSAEGLATALFHWMEGSELGEFVEFVEDKCVGY